MKPWFAADLDEPERAFLTTLVRGQIPAGSEIVLRRRVRRVCRVVLPSGRSAFVKEHLFPSIGVRLRYAHRASPTQHEAAMLRLAADRELLVPRPLAEATERGLLGPRRALLVTLALPESEPIPPARRFEAACELAQAGFFHPDLHGDNMRSIEGQIWFLDFQSVRFRPRGVRGHARRRMLAKVAHHLRPDLGDERLHSLLGALAEAPERILVVADRLAAAEAASRRRHRLRDSTAVRRERKGLLGTRLVLRDRHLPDVFEREQKLPYPSGGSCLLAASQEGSVLRIRRRGRLRRIWLEGENHAGGILAWERDGPWPCAMQSLYISNPMGGSDLATSLDAFLGRGRSRPEVATSPGFVSHPEE